MGLKMGLQSVSNSYQLPTSLSCKFANLCELVTTPDYKRVFISGNKWLLELFFFSGSGFKFYGFQNFPRSHFSEKRFLGVFLKNSRIGSNYLNLLIFILNLFKRCSLGTDVR